MKMIKSQNANELFFFFHHPKVSNRKREKKKTSDFSGYTRETEWGIYKVLKAELIRLLILLLLTHPKSTPVSSLEECAG